MIEERSGVHRTHAVFIDDIDGFGMLYHARYLTIVDHAIAEYWFDTGWRFDTATALAVRAVTLDYLAPISTVGAVDVWFRLIDAGRTSITYGFEVCSGDVVAARGTRVMVHIDRTTGRPVPFDADAWHRADPLMTDEVRAKLAARVA